MAWRSLSKKALMCFAGAATAWILMGPGGDDPGIARGDQERGPTGHPQLISYQPLPESGECLPTPAPLFAVYAQAVTAGGQQERKPRRVIHDSRPTFSAVAVDPVRDEVAVQDENLFQILFYNRLDNTPPQAAMTEPKRTIGGIHTKVEFNCGLYIDPKTGDTYSVNNDTVDTLVIFPRDAQGNVAPARELYTPHGTYGIAVDEENHELFLTVEHDSAIVVYRKSASSKDAPIRLLQGDDTLLADPHGIAVDARRDRIFVTNHGSVHQVRESSPRRRENWPLDRNKAVRGSGKLLPPSITVYPRTAQGNAAPLAVIQGGKTRLNWPSGIAVDSDVGELFVANDADDSILVFKVGDRGNVAPTRVIRGPKTGIKNPTNLAIDLQNRELWVANMGNHSVTAYPLNGEGDVLALRTIRSAPMGKKAMAIGNPGGVAYDSKRKEILVPN